MHGYDARTLAADIGAGMTVGVVALPLAMAFAIASGVKPEHGLFTAIIAGFIISALGGSNVQIGGPAGAFIVIVYGIVSEYGLGNLLVATCLAGLLLFVMGLFRLGGVVRYIPVSIVLGFTNGIAVLIGLSQLRDLLGLDIPNMPADFPGQVSALWTHLGQIDATALAIGAASLGLVLVWPKAYAMPIHPTGRWQRLIRWVAHVPGTVVVLVLATAVTAAMNLNVPTIGSRFGGIPRSLPGITIPDVSLGALHSLLIPTLTIAILGAIESLLCARVADNVTEGLPRHDPNQELMAQGVANMVVPFFGGIPATGTIARTVTNVRAGARTPIAGIVHAVTLLAVVLLGAPLAQHVPLAALAGLLLFVAWNMGEWSRFGRLQRYAPSYRWVVLATFALTIVFGLTIAVEVGILMACAFFVYRMSQLFRANKLDAPGRLPADVVVIELFGSLFFGAVGKVESLEADIPAGTHAVVLDMHQLISIDTSGIEALEQLHRSLAQREVRLMLAQLDEHSRSLIERAGLADALGPGALAATLQQALSTIARDRRHPDERPSWPSI